MAETLTRTAPGALADVAAPTAFSTSTDCKKANGCEYPNYCGPREACRPRPIIEGPFTDVLGPIIGETTHVPTLTAEMIGGPACSDVDFDLTAYTCKRSNGCEYPVDCAEEGKCIARPIIQGPIATLLS